MLPTERIVAYVTSEDERATVFGAAPDCRVLFCNDIRQVAAAVAATDVRLVILELHGDADADLRAVADAVNRRAFPIPVLFRFALRRTTTRQLVACQSNFLDIRFSLRGFDSLREGVIALLSRVDTSSAREAIVSRVGPVVPTSVLEIVIGAAVVGERRASVGDLASLVAMSVRSVESRLVVSQTMGAKRLLSHMLVLHTCWRVSRLGWTRKRAATAAGFHSPGPLTNWLKRATGMRPSYLLDEHVFGERLEHFISQLRSDLPP